MNREIRVTAQGLVSTIEGGYADLMPEGDPVFAERLRRLAARDCARRQLLGVMLPSLDAVGRQLVREEIAKWPYRESREAAYELLKLAGWPDDVERCVACGKPQDASPDREPELCRDCTISQHEALDVVEQEAA